MKWDFKIVVLLVEWSSFRGGIKAGFYCIIKQPPGISPPMAIKPWADMNGQRHEWSMG